MSGGGGDPRRALPAMDRLLDLERVEGWLERAGREPVRRALRKALDEARERLGGEDGEAPPPVERLLQRAEELLAQDERPSLRPVLNGTGVVLHTNLGRAPLAAPAIASVDEVAAGYSNLEFDLRSGTRGSRYGHCRDLLRELTGAEDALVVNNNAAAVSLVVNEFARGGEVVVSRGELVEIGGSFRIPDVVERSGARLREVGTTNRTRIEDYREALGDETGLILKVHPSNYRIRGFTREVELGELVRLGAEAGVPVAHDLGSGLLRPGLHPDLPPEPGPADALSAGADLVTWSGDKLLGGPQAGVVVGEGAAVARLRENPLLRAFRVDKMTLAAMEATLRLYRDPERAAGSVPVARALRASAGELAERAEAALSGLETPEGTDVSVARMEAAVGGGSHPGVALPSAGWRVSGVDPDALDRACRRSEPPLVGRIQEGAFLVDFRTLLPGQGGRAAEVLQAALRGLGPGSDDEPLTEGS